MGRRVAVGGRQALQALRPALRAWEQIGIFPLRPTALTGTLGSGAARDLDLPPHPPPSPPTESVLCRALPGLIKQGNEQLGWGDESPGWLEAGTVYDGRLQLVTLGEVSSHNPGGAACRSLSKPRECWVLEGGLAGVLRGSGLGEQLVQAPAQALASPQAGASLATTTCHPILFDAMAEPGAAS